MIPRIDPRALDVATTTLWNDELLEDITYEKDVEQAARVTIIAYLEEILKGMPISELELSSFYL